MNITPTQLAAQYERALVTWPFVHRVEAEAGLPAFALFAVGSRETNLDPYYVDHPGDGGHGRGLWQLDDRSWEIPDPFPVELQARRAAALLRSLIDAEGGDLVRALNRYNSGSPLTARTTGRDYGPDVAERMAWLDANYFAFPIASPPRPQEVNMLIYYHGDIGFLFANGRSLVLTGDDKEALKAAGVPEVLGNRSDELAKALLG